MNSNQLLDAIGLINDEAIQDAKTYRRSKPYYGVKLFLIAAAIVLLSTTAMAAAWILLRPAEVPKQFNNHTLSDAFDSEKAIIINDSITSGEYTFTLMAVVNGEGISDYFGTAVERQPERTFVILAVQNADGTPIQMETFDDELSQLMVSPLVKGLEPLWVNVASMGGSASSCLVDGVVYRLVECDSFMMFADRGLYLGVCSSPFIMLDTFKFDKITGEITANPDSPGINIVFDLPVDASYADPERAEQYLEQLYHELGLDDVLAASENSTP